tara:strand:+ start:14415 stop:15257 length:843 start_codon:yes stop_codon:yes gene_type:complete
MADFINKTLNFPEELKKDEDGLSFHIIEKGKKIYRGDSFFANKKYDIEKMNTEMLGKDYVYFGFSQCDIEDYNYGKPFEFEVIKKDGLRLLRVDNIETLKKIYDDSDNEGIKYIIQTNYILNDNHWRDSKKEKDYAFIEYLCKTYPKYDGYISDKVEQDINWLNAEMAICNPIKKVKLIQKLEGMKTDEEYICDLNLRNAAPIKPTYPRSFDAQIGESLFSEGESLFSEGKKRKTPVTTPTQSPKKKIVYQTPGGKKKSKKSKKSKKAKKQTRKKKGKKN